MKNNKTKDFNGTCLWCEKKEALRFASGNYTNSCGECLIEMYKKTNPQDVFWVEWGVKNNISPAGMYSEYLIQHGLV